MNEKKLRKLLDYQKFEANPELQKLIKETEKKYPQKLSDDDLEFLNAAGPIIVELHDGAQGNKIIR